MPFSSNECTFNFRYHHLSMEYELLKEVIQNLELFEKTASTKDKSLTIEGFSAFLQAEMQKRLSAPRLQEYTDAYLNSLIARDISYLYRYMRGYMRKAIKTTKLQTTDDYIYLVTIMARGPITKTDLNLCNVMEKTTGAEIIKRLLTLGLIEQTSNPNDKRSLLVSITPEGREELKKLFPELQVSADIFLSSLNRGQKQILLQLHTKINQANMSLFMEHRDTPLNQLKTIISQNKDGEK